MLIVFEISDFMINFSTVCSTSFEDRKIREDRISYEFKFHFNYLNENNEQGFCRLFYNDVESRQDAFDKIVDYYQRGEKICKLD